MTCTSGSWLYDKTRLSLSKATRSVSVELAFFFVFRSSWVSNFKKEKKEAFFLYKFSSVKDMVIWNKVVLRIRKPNKERGNKERCFD
jgi:hypothetical protein